VNNHNSQNHVNNSVSGDLIKLNVGGYRYETTRNTLMSIPDTFFVSLLSGRFPSFKDDEGAYFIDRDGQYFRPILTFLRTARIPELSDMTLEDLLAEAEFYLLHPLIKIIKEKIQKTLLENKPKSLSNPTGLCYGTAPELYSKIEEAWMENDKNIEEYESLIVNSLLIFGQKYGVLQATISVEEVPQGHLGPQQPNAVTVQKGRGIIRIFTEKANAFLCEKLAWRFQRAGFLVACEGPKSEGGTTFSIFLDWTTLRWV